MNNIECIISCSNLFLKLKMLLKFLLKFELILSTYFFVLFCFFFNAFFRTQNATPDLNGHDVYVSMQRFGSVMKKHMNFNAKQTDNVPPKVGIG